MLSLGFIRLSLIIASLPPPGTLPGFIMESKLQVTQHCPAVCRYLKEQAQ